MKKQGRAHYLMLPTVGPAQSRVIFPKSARCCHTKASRPTTKEGPKFIQRLVAKQKLRTK